jgi:membrane protease YdiL (CAAX protease family)
MNPFYLPDGRLRPGWRVLLGVLVAIAANWLAAVVATIGIGRRGSSFAFELVYRPTVMLLLLGGFSLLLAFADQVDDHLWAAQGLGREHWAQRFFAGLAIGAGMIAVAVSAIATSGNLALQPAPHAHRLGAFFAVLFILASAALAEELMFRGYPFQRLLEAVGAVPAVLVLSALFAYMHHLNPHASNWAMVNTVAVGVLLAVAYLRTRSLWLPWGIHFGWNAALGLGFGLPVSGLDFSVLVKGTARGPQWLTGGAYGLEASALGTVVIVLGFLPVTMLFPGRSLAPPAPPSISPDPGAGLGGRNQ